MSIEQHIQEMEQWRYRIGSFIISFGEIEMISHLLWHDYFPNKKPPIEFQKRTTNIMSSLRKDGKGELANLFVEAMRLAEKRNTIAHNPVMVQVFQKLDTSEHFTDLAIKSSQDETYIDDNKLNLLLQQCEHLIGDIHRAMKWSTS